ncbi:MAG: pyridoxamine 5'-phosphate oxidase [Chloroflexi bacterium]|nr:pyridoxamine 5'-phosphate oxidase [Chloroflexota bacterium]
MDFHDCIEFANKNPACWLATVDGDQPRVRGFLMWFADETGFYFHTGSTKQVCHQLKENPKIEVCFYAPEPPPGTGRMMRVAGTVEFIDDIPLKTVLLEERPFLKSIGTGRPDNPLLAVFRIARGEAHFWTMADNLRESEAERIGFHAPPWPRGHYSEKPRPGN